MNRMGLTPEHIARAKQEGAAAGAEPYGPNMTKNPYLTASGAEPTSLNRFLARVWREERAETIQRRAAERKLARRAAEAPGSQLPETSSVED